MELSLDTFNTALAGIKCPMVLDHKALETVIARKGMGTVLRAIDEAAADNAAAIVALRNYGQVAGFLAQLTRCGLRGTTYDQGASVLRAQGLDAVRTVVSGALRGDALHRRQLSQWLCDAADQESGQGAAGVETAPAPVPAAATAASSPRPRSAGQVERAGATPINPTVASQQGAVPPRHGTQPVSVARNSMPPPNAHQNQRRDAEPPRGSDFGRHSDEPPMRDNVHRIYRDDRDEPRSRSGGEGDDAPQRTSAPRGNSESGTRQYLQAKAHGGRAALTFDATTNRHDEPTVCVEAAEGSNKVYDWKNKLRFQLTRNEFELMTSLLYHDLEGVRFSNHDDKWLSADWQTGQYAGTIKFTLGKGKANEFAPRTCQVDENSIGEVLDVFLKQMALLRGCREDEVRGRCIVTTRMHLAKQQARGNRQQQGQSTGGGQQRSYG
ncbi:hypothetical protein IMW82_13870 [Rhodanobacter sp. B2A1Ga4]|uniref:hypothetical protein n=1 Tax=Rhodanobacter sp. B2A1Ga4 TaxID=2778647 RepID=UPI001B371283|nr:hypothetical protein [Rhodanobacter sp. B2A1Ga4]MBQ4855761.1 hypothetical protein [Rhodanobacter sp. B2A1Ga4]